MSSAKALQFSGTVERKSPSLPRYVVVSEALVAPWSLEGTTVVQVTLDGTDLGRRTLKRWGRDRAVWFFELTGKQCSRAGVEKGDRVDVELRRASEEPPEEILRLLEADSSARSTWEGLTLAQRRSLSEHVRSAARPDTRERRAAKGLRTVTLHHARESSFPEDT